MDRDYARSMVITHGGICATSQTLASQAGAMTLARGGNAVDAAIAANAVLAVVEPMSCGIGGDLFAMVCDGTTGKLSGLNASGWAPAGLNAALRARGCEAVPEGGILSATVPGCVDGWSRLHARMGRMAWADLFRPAIHFAHEGFAVTEMIQGSWAEMAEKVGPAGVPEVGEWRTNAPLGAALEAIAREGAAAFYRGGVGQALLETSRRLEGAFEESDLSEFESEWVEPISTTYRGWRVCELPPNGQGIAALEMLNTLERYGLGEMDPLGVEAFHLKMEAQRMAYAHLARYVGDPRFVSVPVDRLLRKPELGRGDTVYLCAVDRDGMVVSLIQSIFHAFGSGVRVDECGFYLHNRASMFVMDEGHPNQLQPRKRPFHTIIPAYMEKDGTRVGFGIMGGLNQAQAHAQFVTNVVDHGMNIQAALEAPRFTRLSFGGGEVLMESRVPAETVQGLWERGHDVRVVGAYSAWMGGGQAVLREVERGVNYGASSPRKDGAAVPEPDPYFS